LHSAPQVWETSRLIPIDPQRLQRRWLIILQSIEKAVRVVVFEHERPVTAVAFRPDGRRVVTGDDAGVLRTWDACTGCLDPQALLALARKAVTRDFTPAERATLLETDPD